MVFFLRQSKEEATHIPQVTFFVCFHLCFMIHPSLPASVARESVYATITPNQLLQLFNQELPLSMLGTQNRLGFLFAHGKCSSSL
jgi:hypothetical protein